MPSRFATVANGYDRFNYRSGLNMIVIGLVVLLAALVVGVIGVVSNAGSEHLLTDGFAISSYHVTGSTGTVFLYGIVVGAVAVVGLSLVLAGAIRATGRSRAARAELKRAQQESELVNRDRDRLLERQHDVHDRNGAVRTTGGRTSSNRRWWQRRGSDSPEPAPVPPSAT